MITYEDLLSARMGSETDVMALVQAAVSQHKATSAYKWATDAVLYDKKRNPTIEAFQRLLYTMSGKAVPDNFSPNWKTKTLVFPYFVQQEVGYLLGNGVSFQLPDTKKRLGRSFDREILNAWHDALVQGAAFVLWNNDKIQHFQFTEFAPLYSEETGALCGGVRWWQIDTGKPTRYTLYELDGYTEYKQTAEDGMVVIQPKTPYLLTVRQTEFGEEIVDGQNYSGLPIVPLYADRYHQSRLVGLKEGIDCYDFIKSGFANDVDEASVLYWTVTNAGGMNEVDFVKFREQLKMTHFAGLDDDVSLESHAIDPPFQARNEALDRLIEDLYRDDMALDVRRIEGNSITATQIRYSYEPLDKKVDEAEAQVTECIHGILDLLGIEDEPGYERNRITNQYEETQMVMLAAEHLDEETLLSKLPFMTPDDVQECLRRLAQDDYSRFNGGGKASERVNALNGSQGNETALGDGAIDESGEVIA